MYYVYMLKTEEGTYIGYTSDLKRRFQEHAHRKPELIYYEAYRHELDARDRERMLKHRGQSVRRLKEKIKRSLG
ncbi:MAG: GIY-YIG nuclease family protein [Patescibacteria group bacterium]